MSCLDQVRKLYTEYTGLDISAAIAQVRAELTEQRNFEQSTESVTTYKYNPLIQEQMGPIVWPKPEPKKVRKPRAKKEDDLLENDE